MSGAMIEFPTKGTSGRGYFAVPASGRGPGVIVLQEWWGLVDHIKTVAGRTVDFTICDGADHASFNDTRAEVYDEVHAATCWSRMLAFYQTHVR